MAMQPQTVTHQASASYALLLAIVASLGGFLFGYDTVGEALTITHKFEARGESQVESHFEGQSSLSR